MKQVFFCIICDADTDHTDDGHAQAMRARAKRVEADIREMEQQIDAGILTPHGNRAVVSPVKTTPENVKTKALYGVTTNVKTNVKTKRDATNSERQKRWQSAHRDEFNRKRRERYHAHKEQP